MEALRDIMAGTIAGSAGIIVGHPLDSIVCNHYDRHIVIKIIALLCHPCEVSIF